MLIQVWAAGSEPTDCGEPNGMVGENIGPGPSDLFGVSTVVTSGRPRFDPGRARTEGSCDHHHHTPPPPPPPPSLDTFLFRCLVQHDALHHFQQPPNKGHPPKPRLSEMLETAQDFYKALGIPHRGLVPASVRESLFF